MQKQELVHSIVLLKLQLLKDILIKMMQQHQQQELSNNEEIQKCKGNGYYFCSSYFSLVVNILYLGATGKHLISGENIASFAKNRSKKEVVEYAQRGQIYTCDHEK